MTLFEAASQYLVEKHGLPADWRVYAGEVGADVTPPTHVKFEGAVATVKDGRATWPKRKEHKRVFFAAKADLAAWHEAWHVTQGTCPVCDGTGAEVIGWNRDTGKLTRPCKRCGETGNYREAGK